MESDYDPEIGYTVSFTHMEQSGSYTCKVIDDPSHEIQFHIIVNANCEFNCSRSDFDTKFQTKTNSTVDIYELLYGDGPMSSHNNTEIMFSNLRNKEDELGRFLDQILLVWDERKSKIGGLCCVVFE